MISSNLSVEPAFKDSFEKKNLRIGLKMGSKIVKYFSLAPSNHLMLFYLDLSENLAQATIYSKILLLQLVLDER